MLLTSKGVPFDSAQWKASNVPADRAAMVDDLIKNHIRVGMPMTEIVSILGMPPKVLSKQDNVDNKMPGNTTYAWWLGNGYDYNSMWDDMYLYVSFSKNNRVVNIGNSGIKSSQKHRLKTNHLDRWTHLSGVNHNFRTLDLGNRSFKVGRYGICLYLRWLPSLELLGNSPCNWK
ncbi:MAG: hypothetical protein GY804_13910 [Alphaproteobacteria bacterium]|nr:hypothetical protein [Alphaproteobacteria bacterium]